MHQRRQQRWASMRAVVVSFLSSTILFLDRIRKPRKACCCLFFFFSGGVDFRPEPLISTMTCTNDDGRKQRFWAVARRAARSAAIVVLPDLFATVFFSGGLCNLQQQSVRKDWPLPIAIQMTSRNREIHLLEVAERLETRASVPSRIF
ncbi:hypothetical protein AAC387_Pa01g1914 [Persea americana]